MFDCVGLKSDQIKGGTMSTLSRVKSRWLTILIVAMTLSLTSVFQPSQAADSSFDPYDTNQWLVQAAQEASAIPGGGSNRQARSRNLSQLGFLPLPGFNADVWAHKGFAYVGSWGTFSPVRPLCPATGVRIIDLSDRSNPTLVGAVAAIPGTSQEDVVVARINTAFFTGDLLVTGIQACRRITNAPRGIDLWDVTDPRNPVHLAFWPSGPFGPAGARGVHELYLFQRGNRAYVTAAVPASEFIEGEGDFRLVDVTDPYNPVQVSDWGAINDGGLTPGPGQAFFDHSAWANQTGRVAILSYWDAGAIFLDISDPTNPTFIGRTIYPPGADGDTHSIWLARGENLLLTADEDFNPTNGSWGFLRVWDVKNPAAPVEIGRFATPNTTVFPPPKPGFFSIHNPFVRGQTAYLSWYSDGVRVVDISQPRAPREIASFVPPDTPDPFKVFPNAAVVWGVYVDRDLILLSDINAGLYVLKHVP